MTSVYSGTALIGVVFTHSRQLLLSRRLLNAMKPDVPLESAGDLNTVDKTGN